MVTGTQDVKSIVSGFLGRARVLVFGGDGFEIFGGKTSASPGDAKRARSAKF